MLSKQEKSQILNVLQSPGWRTIEQFSIFICNEIKNTSCVRDTEWETLKALLLVEGQTQGIKMFINEIYKTQKENE